MTQQYGSKLKGERMLSVREAAEVMGLCLDSVRRKLRAGLMPGVRVGRSWRVSESQLANYLGVDRISAPAPEIGKGTRGSAGSSQFTSELATGDLEAEVAIALLRTDAARLQVLQLVKTALSKSEVTPAETRRILKELSFLFDVL